ncbi:MAG: hypothetical protein QM537_04470 [Candidatus Symbiobacter sp.]|nr:hypothetical protein [Candidatus Symbiobacter sp.]
MTWKMKNIHAVSAPQRLGRELAIVIIVKVAIILVAGFTLFGHRARLHVDADVMATQLFNSPPPAAPLTEKR